MPDPYQVELNRSAALTRVAREGGRAVSAPARAAFMETFIEQVDPDRELPEDERDKRAAAARKAYFAKLAARSAKARRNRREQAEAKAEADQLRHLADAIEAGEVA